MSARAEEAEEEAGGAELDQEAAEQAAEAAELVERAPADSDESLTPETLEEQLEGGGRPPEGSLHEEDQLVEALPDEGGALEGFPDDEVELEMELHEGEEAS